MKLSPPTPSLVAIALILQTALAAEQKETVNPNVAKATLKILQDNLLKATEDQAISKISRSILNNSESLVASEMQPSKASEISAAKKAGTKLTPDQGYYVGFWLLRAYAAVHADNASAGRQAASVLKNLGLENTQERAELNVLAALNLKGWLYNDSTNSVESARPTAAENSVPAQIKNVLGSHSAPKLETGSLMGPGYRLGKLTFSISADGKTIHAKGHYEAHVTWDNSCDDKTTAEFSGSCQVQKLLRVLQGKEKLVVKGTFYRKMDPSPGSHRPEESSGSQAELYLDSDDNEWRFHVDSPMPDIGGGFKG
jgi:hypothetical protein